MPSRTLVGSELDTLFGVLSHPDRIRIIEELRDRELDVNSLQAILSVPHSRVSQHMALLRSHRLVAERREGRHVYYRLTQPRLADWVRAGVDLLQNEWTHGELLRSAVEEMKALWGGGGSGPGGGTE